MYGHQAHTGYPIVSTTDLLSNGLPGPSGSAIAFPITTSSHAARQSTPYLPSASNPYFEDFWIQAAPQPPMQHFREFAPRSVSDGDIDSDTAIDSKKERRKAQNRIAQRLFRQRKDLAIKQSSDEVERLTSRLKNFEQINCDLSKQLVDLKAKISRLEKENDRLRVGRMNPDSCHWQADFSKAEDRRNESQYYRGGR